jgi:hypothetical protein
VAFPHRKTTTYLKIGEALSLLVIPAKAGRLTAEGLVIQCLSHFSAYSRATSLDSRSTRVSDIESRENDDA